MAHNLGSNPGSASYELSEFWKSIYLSVPPFHTVAPASKSPEEGYTKNL